MSNLQLFRILCVACAITSPLCAEPVVKSALPIGKTDDAMLASAEKMSADELRELLDLYSKKHEQVMTIRVANLLLKLEPEDAEARGVLARAGQPLPAESGETTSPTVLAAQKLTAGGDHKGAVALYEKARAAHDPKVPFAFAMELASAYDDAGMSAQALAAYEAISKDPSSPPADRDDAARRISEIGLGRKLASADQALDGGRLDEAKTIIGGLSEADQRSPAARILQAKTILKGGNPAAGEAALMQLSTDRSLPAETRQEALQMLSDVKLDSLLKDGQEALDHFQTAAALTLSEQAYTLRATRADVIQFRAKALLADGQVTAARALLEAAAKPDEVADQLDQKRLLARTLEQTPDLAQAIRLYRELGADSSLSLLDRDDALDSAETIAAAGSARSQLDWRFIDAAEGRWNVAHVSVQSGLLSHGLQFVGEGFWDAIAPSAGANFSGHTSPDQLEASGGLRWHVGPSYFVQATVTGHADGVGFGLDAGKFAQGGFGYDLRYDYQQRAAYSQALRSLNGRQNRVAGSFQGNLGWGVYGDTSLAWRQVTVDHESVASGVAFEISLLKTIIQETASLPGLSLAYVGEISRSQLHNTPRVRRAVGLDATAGKERLAELVDPRVNRQEAQISLVRHWTDRFETSLTGAVGYEFEDVQSVWRLSGQLAYRLRPNLRLTLEGDYDSSGQGANSGSAMKSIWLGVAIDY